MPSPAAILLVSPTCPHCGAMKQVLGVLKQDGEISSLDIIDITKHPEEAEKRRVRSVPWLQIGELVLEGAQTKGELQKWAELASEPDALSEYFRYTLAAGELSLADRMMSQQPVRLRSLLPLVEDPETEMSVRIGIAAIVEARRGNPELEPLVNELIRLCRHQDSTVRADACHLLIQTGSPLAIDVLHDLVNDKSSQVREIAVDGLEEFKTQPKPVSNG